ncbi:MAG: hypothetical protein ACLSGB_11000 [Dorea sp.]
MFNPISISLKEIQKIGNNLEQFEKYLHEIQALGRILCDFKCLSDLGRKLIGIYAPWQMYRALCQREPYVIMNQIEGVAACM